jgi:hypothetical protein
MVDYAAGHVYSADWSDAREHSHPLFACRGPAQGAVWPGVTAECCDTDFISPVPRVLGSHGRTRGAHSILRSRTCTSNATLCSSQFSGSVSARKRFNEVPLYGRRVPGNECLDICTYEYFGTHDRSRGRQSNECGGDQHGAYLRQRLLEGN